MLYKNPYILKRHLVFALISTCNVLMKTSSTWRICWQIDFLNSSRLNILNLRIVRLCVISPEFFYFDFFLHVSECVSPLSVNTLEHRLTTFALIYWSLFVNTRVCNNLSSNQSFSVIEKRGRVTTNKLLIKWLWVLDILYLIYKLNCIFFYIYILCVLNVSDTRWIDWLINCWLLNVQ